MSESEILNIIKSTALRVFPGSRIILFGSRARKENTRDSDYDVLLITNKNIKPEEKIPYRTQIRKALLNYGILSDILIQSEKEIEIKKHLTGHIIKTIIEEGIAL